MKFVRLRAKKFHTLIKLIPIVVQVRNFDTTVCVCAGIKRLNKQMIDVGRGTSE